jgi:hypothetical protein
MIVEGDGGAGRGAVVVADVVADRVRRRRGRSRSDDGVVSAAVVSGLGFATPNFGGVRRVGRLSGVVHTRPAVDRDDALRRRVVRHRMRRGVGDHAERRERKDPDAHGEESLGKRGHR